MRGRRHDVSEAAHAAAIHLGVDCPGAGTGDLSGDNRALLYDFLVAAVGSTGLCPTNLLTLARSEQGDHRWRSDCSFCIRRMPVRLASRQWTYCSRCLACGVCLSTLLMSPIRQSSLSATGPAYPCWSRMAEHSTGHSTPKLLVTCWRTGCPVETRDVRVRTARVALVGSICRRRS